MSFFRKILGYRDFECINSIKEFLIKKALISGARESLDYLLLFKTSKQRTWILADATSVFCFLDDTSKDSFELRWKEHKENLKDNISINWDYKPGTGTIDFGQNHKRWLCTKNLFQNKEHLSNEIEKLIKKSES